MRSTEQHSSVNLICEFSSLWEEVWGLFLPTSMWKQTINQQLFIQNALIMHTGQHKRGRLIIMHCAQSTACVRLLGGRRSVIITNTADPADWNVCLVSAIDAVTARLPPEPPPHTHTHTLVDKSSWGGDNRGANKGHCNDCNNVKPSGEISRPWIWTDPEEKWTRRTA